MKNIKKLLDFSSLNKEYTIVDDDWERNPYGESLLLELINKTIGDSHLFEEAEKRKEKSGNLGCVLRGEEIFFTLKIKNKINNAIFNIKFGFYAEIDFNFVLIDNGVWVITDYNFTQTWGITKDSRNNPHYIVNVLAERGKDCDFDVEGFNSCYLKHKFI